MNPPVMDQLKAVCGCCFSKTKAGEENEGLLQGSGALGALLVEAGKMAVEEGFCYEEEVKKRLLALPTAGLESGGPLLRLIMLAAQRSNAVYTSSGEQSAVLTTAALSGAPDSEMIHDVESSTVFLVLRGTYQ